MVLPALLFAVVVQQTPSLTEPAPDMPPGPEVSGASSAPVLAPANPVVAPSVVTPPVATPGDVTPNIPTPVAGFDSLVQEDVDPSVGVLRTQALDIRVGGILQLHTALYAGPDSLIANGDPANQAGFRVRRARFGVEGWFRDRVGVLLSVNALETDTDVGVLSDAKISYEHRRWLRLAIGSGKVPFSRGALESSRTLASIERPLVVTQLTPGRRLGLTAEGELFNGRVAYLTAFMNGTEGFALGNRFGGFLTGGRLIFALWGSPRRGELTTSGLALAASALYESGPAVRTTAASADLLLALAGASLQLEGICDWKVPQTVSTIGGVTDSTSRCGGYAEAGYAFRLFGRAMQVLGRAEVFDDNRALADVGDNFLFSAGINVALYDRFVRAQLHYVGRREPLAAERQNDGVVMALQGAF